MIGQFGFSYVGLIYLLMLFIPNIIWSRRLPADYTSAGENRLLVVFERAGQVLCTFCALVFSGFNLAPFSARSVWLIVSFALMLLYEAGWVRYFRSKQTQGDFYRSFLGIPVPLATLPVAAFLLLGIYGGVGLMAVSSIILGIGHIGIHIQHLKKQSGQAPHQ